MALSYTFYKNDGTSVSEQLPFMPATPFPDPAADFGWSVQGKTFKGWNTESDGSGTFYYAGDTIFTETTFYAIWEAPVITYLTTDRDLTSIANAIRTKGGTSAQLAFPQGFVDAVEAIETGGGGWSIDDITRYAGITGNIEITNASVGDYCLYGRTGITGVSLPNLVTGAQNAFRGCTGIAQISAPKLVTGKQAMFNGAFAVGSSVHFPKLSNFGGGGMFEGARFAIGVFPAVTNLYGSAFGNSTYIHVIDLGPNLTTIGSQNNNFKGQSWGNQHGLETLILRRSASVVSLANLSNFANSRFASGSTGGGKIYIPKALYDHLGDGSSLDYRAATNWSTLYGYGTFTFEQIEGSVYETEYADGTPIE